MGPVGEREYGRRNFMDVTSLFLTEPLLAVRWGQRDLGSVDRSSLASRDDARALLERAGGSVKLAIVMNASHVERDEAERLLAEKGGVVRRVIGGAPPPVAITHLSESETSWIAFFSNSRKGFSPRF